MITQMDKVLIP